MVFYAYNFFFFFLGVSCIKWPWIKDKIIKKWYVITVFITKEKKNIELSLLWIPKEILQCKALSPLVYSSMVLDRNFSYNCNINKNRLAKVTRLNQEKERLKKEMYLPFINCLQFFFFLSFIERMYFSLTSREMRFLSDRKSVV